MLLDIVKWYLSSYYFIFMYIHIHKHTGLLHKYFYRLLNFVIPTVVIYL